MAPIILISRPQGQSERFEKQLRASVLGNYETVISPALQIDLVPLASDLGTDTHLIFTSENAVRAYAQTDQQNRHVAYCVGDRTTAAARKIGLNAVSARGTAEDLIELVKIEAPKLPLQYLHGAMQKVDIVARLRALGFEAHGRVAYAQSPMEPNQDAKAAFSGTHPVILPVFSPATATVMSQSTKTASAPLFVVAMSDDVAAAWSGPASQIAIAQKPDAPSMCQAIALLLDNTLP